VDSLRRSIGPQVISPPEACSALESERASICWEKIIEGIFANWKGVVCRLPKSRLTRIGGTSDYEVFAMLEVECWKLSDQRELSK